MTDIKIKIAAAERNETVSWTFEDLEPLLKYAIELRKLIGETGAVFEGYALDHEQKAKSAITGAVSIIAEEKRDRNLTWAARLRKAIT